MTATLKKTPILFAALLTVATPAFAADWKTIPGTDGVCTLYNQNLDCMDAARTFLAANDGTIQMRVVNVSPNVPTCRSSVRCMPV